MTSDYTPQEHLIHLKLALLKLNKILLAHAGHEKRPAFLSRITTVLDAIDDWTSFTGAQDTAHWQTGDHVYVDAWNLVCELEKKPKAVVKRMAVYG